MFLRESFADPAQGFGSNTQVGGDIVLGDPLEINAIVFHCLQISFFRRLKQEAVHAFIQAGDQVFRHQPSEAFDCPMALI